MVAIVVYFLGVVTWTTLGSAAKLPPYFKPCVRTPVASFKACALQSLSTALPLILPGDQKYRIQSLNPIRISTISVNHNGLILNLKDVDVYGTDSSTLKDVDVDFDKLRLSYTIFMPQCIIHSDYEAKGRITILPITGQGRMNMTFDDMEYKFTTEYDIVRKNGKDYMSFKDNHIDYTLSKVYLTLTNLFNGNKLLGDQMNQFFGDNWRDLNKAVGPAVAQGLSAGLGQIVSNILSPIPYDELFLKG